MSDQQVSNKEILKLLQEMKQKNETIVVLTPSEVETFRELLKTITVEDLKYIKEYAEDKKAVSRVFGKAKNFLLVTASIVAAYFLIVRNISDPIREFIIRFLSNGGGPGAGI